MRSRRNSSWLLAVAVGLCYFTSLQIPYHFDDVHSIEGNYAIRSISNIPKFWTDTTTSSSVPENRVYRPLTYTFYALCWQVGGGKTWPFHLVKMLMHWVVCLMIFLCWRRLWSIPGWFPINSLQIKLPGLRSEHFFTATSGSLLLAIIFAIHPATSECVDYISATTSLQCAMFYLLAYYFYIRFRDFSQTKYGVGSLILYALSVMSKEEGITLPAMIFITEIFIGSSMAKAAKRALPHTVLAIMLSITLYALHSATGDISRGGESPLTYFMTQWRAYLFYMRLWFWPFGLNADNTEFGFSSSLGDYRVVLAAIGNGLILTLAWIKRKQYPALLFGLLWFYVTISPASSFIPLGEPVNEHRMYLAYFGFIGGTATLIFALIERSFKNQPTSWRPALFAASILASLFFGTQYRNRVWATSESLWKDVVQKNPSSGRAYNNLAIINMDKGDYTTALQLLSRCQELLPNYSSCPLNIGISYMDLKNYKAAHDPLFRAYELDRDNPLVSFNMGQYFEEYLNDNGKATEFFQQADRLSSNIYIEAKERLAKIALRENRSEDLRRLLEEILHLDPENKTSQAILSEMKK